MKKAIDDFDMGISSIQKSMNPYFKKQLFSKKEMIMKYSKYKIPLGKSGNHPYYLDIREAQRILGIGLVRTGKFQTLDSIIYTPDGPKKNRDLKINDEICTPDGKTAKIIGLFPQGKKDIYKITFNDGSSTECGLKHLWKVKKVFGTKYQIVTTAWLIKEINKYNNKGRKKHCTYKQGSYIFSIPITQPVYFKKQEILIDPYLLGVYLGNGCSRGRQLSIGTNTNDQNNTVNKIIF
jgi:hypothetical protein